MFDKVDFGDSRRIIVFNKYIIALFPILWLSQKSDIYVDLDKTKRKEKKLKRVLVVYIFPR